MSLLLSVCVKVWLCVSSDVYKMNALLSKWYCAHATAIKLRPVCVLLLTFSEQLNFGLQAGQNTERISAIKMMAAAMSRRSG